MACWRYQPAAVPITQPSVVAQVDLQRCDRDAAIGDRMEVGAFAALAGVASGADPIDGFATRVGLPDHGLTGVAPAQTRDAPRQARRIGAVGDVHVQQPWQAARPCQRAAGQHLVDH